jgi:hypothetical protein
VGTFCSQTYLRGKPLDEVFRIPNCPPCERALLGHGASNGFACRDSVAGGGLDIERPDDRVRLKEALQARWILWVCSPRVALGVAFALPKAESKDSIWFSLRFQHSLFTKPFSFLNRGYEFVFNNVAEESATSRSHRSPHLPS